MKYETYKIITKRGEKNIYCKKNELLNFMTAIDFIELEKIEVINRASDKTKHKPITKEDLLNYINK